MNQAAINEAQQEAKRFLKRVQELKNAEAEAKDNRFYTPDCGVERAAVRRSSMDLTRALAKMRRSQ